MAHQILEGGTMWERKWIAAAVLTMWMVALVMRQRRQQISINKGRCLGWLKEHCKLIGDRCSGIAVRVILYMLNVNLHIVSWFVLVSLITGPLLHQAASLQQTSSPLHEPQPSMIGYFQCKGTAGRITDSFTVCKQYDIFGRVGLSCRQNSPSQTLASVS